LITSLTDYRSPTQISSFQPKNSVQNSVFLKTCSTFYFFTNSYSIVKISESPPIRDLVHEHIQIQDL